jgi:hypothetical protein
MEADRSSQCLSRTRAFAFSILRNIDRADDLVQRDAAARRARSY